MHAICIQHFADILEFTLVSKIIAITVISLTVWMLDRQEQGHRH